MSDVCMENRKALFSVSIEISLGRSENELIHAWFCNFLCVSSVLTYDRTLRVKVLSNLPKATSDTVTPAKKKTQHLNKTFLKWTHLMLRLVEESCTRTAMGRVHGILWHFCWANHDSHTNPKQLLTNTEGSKNQNKKWVADTDLVAA